jgi:hypothetical protein
VVAYGYETWSVTVREKHRQGMFENAMLRGISESKKDKIMRLENV